MDEMEKKIRELEYKVGVLSDRFDSLEKSYIQLLKIVETRPVTLRAEDPNLPIIP